MQILWRCNFHYHNLITRYLNDIFHICGYSDFCDVFEMLLTNHVKSFAKNIHNPLLKGNMVITSYDIQMNC